MTTDRERLMRVLGGEPLAALRARLRRRFALGREADAIVLSRLQPHERKALEGLLGLRTRAAASLRVSLLELDAVLARAGLASSLREALELIEGPIPDLPAERAERERAWDAVFTCLASPRLSTFCATTQARGLVKRLAASRPEVARALLASTASVLARLPAHGIPRSQVAAETLGDAHGLDPGRPTATLTIAVLRKELAQHAAEGALDEESERETWARAGVLVNELAAPALVLNLPASPDTALAKLVEQAREHGLPLHLSLRNLLRTPARWRVRGCDVFVCENANVVAMFADQLGAACAPLVCTDGMPSSSQRILLAQLAAQGARLRYHGDFDWPGLRIANYVVRTFGATPWRMSVADYIERRGRALEGSPVEASWEPGLSAAMQAGGYALEEEAVANALYDDLRTL